MIQGIIPNTLIALAILPGSLSLHSTPASTTQTGFQMVYETPSSKEPTYIVQKDDSLGSIAQKLCGDSLYWTVLWNDNEWIEDPSLIEPGWTLALRTQKPSQPEKIKDSLQKRLYIPKTSIHVYQSGSVSANDDLDDSSQPIINAQSGAGPLNQAQIQFLGSCEAGMDPAKNTGNGYYGAFQFSYGTWKSMNTEYERADLAPLDVQIDAVQRLLKHSSIFNQFPACARRMQKEGII